MTTIVDKIKLVYFPRVKIHN